MDKRLQFYFGHSGLDQYENTEEEATLLEYWQKKYFAARQNYDVSRCNSKNVILWRNAYEGNFNKLNDDGTISNIRVNAIRKLCYELVQSKLNANIPAPKMSPRYHADLVPVNSTEKLIRHEIDRMMSEEINDESEHFCLIDGFVWLKVSWNPFDNTHERSGNPEVTVCPVDTVFPQPGVKDLKKMEYIFELSALTVSQCYDLYGRYIQPNINEDVINVVNCYFLNKDRYLGKFSWCEDSGQVLCNELEWGIRKRRECKECTAQVNISDTCPVCGSTNFVYKSVKDEILKQDLSFVTNPYRTGKSQDTNDDMQQIDSQMTIPAGTKIPHYLIRQLPFVPYRRVNVPNSIYGIGEIELTFENQDLVNKMLNKASSKIGKSRTYVTKLRDSNINDKNSEVSYVEVESYRDGSAIQVKQVMADIQQEISTAQVLYDIAKSTVGVTNTDQGKQDYTAMSGKAKQLQMAASAQVNSAPNSLRNLAFSNLYELIFKFLLAYSDEDRSFVSLLPDGSPREEIWSKYMFLAQDKYGEYYYRDDFAFSVDTATEITEDRAAMWQLIDNDYINGTMGTAIDPLRANLMYWQMKDQYGYPTAKFAIDFLKSSVEHLPSKIEQALLANPDAVQVALSMIADKNGMNGMIGQSLNRGGARPNSGQKGNGATHAANVEKTNNKNRTESGNAQTNSVATATGGMQGGTNIGQ